ncbi:hypothetical protein, partial [Cyanobium sp. Morenito 9A2]|uniref:hypothetical protein n=1 Tax=Cyanobium sp. Morenito 9A2 TaxID=2823718 RepID=UPI0020CCFDF2
MPVPLSNLPPRRWSLRISGGRVTALAIGCAALSAGAGAWAGDVSATGGALGLGTAVNGRVGGSCGAGLCQVGGGTAAGSNLFHRFSAFDTRGGI